MSSLTEIRIALMQTISQVGLNVYETVPDVTSSPAAVVIPEKARFERAFALGASDEYYFKIPILVAALNIRDAQTQLDAFVTGKGPNSLREFLWQNSTLGLEDVDCRVESFDGYGGNYKSGMTNMIGAVLTVCVVCI